MGVEAKANPILVSGSNQRCIPGSVRFYSIFFTLKTTRKAGGIQVRRCQGFAVAHYGFTLGALALKPCDFCSTGVESKVLTQLWGLQPASPRGGLHHTQLRFSGPKVHYGRPQELAGA